MRQFRSPSRWSWVALVCASSFVVACDNAFEGINTMGIWGFVTVGAKKDAGGAHFANVEGLFFQGNLAAVPNAGFATDTCSDGLFIEGNTLLGVTYIDAGSSVDATVGGVSRTLERTTTSAGLAYRPTAAFSYNPGDSIIVSVTGVPGGFPPGTIRAKTAEPFTFPTDLPIPQGSESIQLNWTAPQDPNSAMVVSLRYETAASPGLLTRHVLCTFVDDGVDSIPFRWHQNWSTSPGQRAVVATRLRTHYVAAGEGNLGVISTYQVPTPPND
jgi:hypothetical protein